MVSVPGVVVAVAGLSLVVVNLAMLYFAFTSGHSILTENPTVRRYESAPAEGAEPGGA